MILSRKDRRKLNKSLKPTKQSPTKSIPIPKQSSAEPFPATFERANNPFHDLFTPQSHAELQPNADTVSDLINSANPTRAENDATNSISSYAVPVFNSTRRDSVLDNDDDDKRQSLRLSTRELVTSIEDDAATKYDNVSNFDDTSSYLSESYPYMSDCTTVDHSEEHTLSSQPIDIECPSRSSSVTFTTIPTARPSPTFGFALFRPTKGHEETPKVDQPSNAQTTISPTPIITASSPSALSNSAHRPGVGLRTDLTASLIFPLDLQNEDELEQYSTVKYNPMRGQEITSGFPSAASSSGFFEMQIVTKLPDGDVIVEECTSSSTISSAWDTGHGYFIPSPSAVASLSDIPFEQLRIGVINGVNADGYPSTPVISAFTGTTSDPTVLGSLNRFQFHDGPSSEDIIPPCSPGSQPTSPVRPANGGGWVPHEEGSVVAGSASGAGVSRQLNSGTIRNDLFRHYEHFPLEAPPSRTAERSRAIREGKKPAKDTTPVLAPDLGSGSARPALALPWQQPGFGGCPMQIPASQGHMVSRFPSSDSGSIFGNTRVMQDIPPKDDRDSGEDGDLSDSVQSLDIAEDSSFDSVSSLDIGRPVGAIDSARLAQHKQEQREKAAARAADWKAREDRLLLERELVHSVEVRELLWANRPWGVKFHPNDRAASTQKDLKTVRSHVSHASDGPTSVHGSVLDPGPSQFCGAAASQASAARHASWLKTAPSFRSQSVDHEDDSELELLETVEALSLALAGMTTKVRNIQARLRLRSAASTLARGQTLASMTGIAGPGPSFTPAESFAGSHTRSTASKSEDVDSASASVTGIAGSLAPSATSTIVDFDTLSVDSVHRTTKQSATADLQKRSCFTKIGSTKDSYANIMPVWLRDAMRKLGGLDVPQALESSPDVQHATFPDGTPVPARLLIPDDDDYDYISADWKYVLETVLNKPPREPVTEADKEIIFQLVKEGYIVPPVFTVRPDVWTDEGGNDVPEGSTRAPNTPGWYVRTREEFMVFCRAMDDWKKNGGDLVET